MKRIIGIGVSLPKKLMEKIDTDRGDIPRSRYLLRILEKHTFEAKKDTGSLDRRIETLNQANPLAIRTLRPDD